MEALNGGHSGDTISSATFSSVERLPDFRGSKHIELQGLHGAVCMDGGVHATFSIHGSCNRAQSRVDKFGFSYLITREVDNTTEHCEIPSSQTLYNQEPSLAWMSSPLYSETSLIRTSYIQFPHLP